MTPKARQSASPLLLCVAACGVAIITVAATLLLPGMLSFSPGISGLIATVAMTATVIWALVRRSYGLAWLAVMLTPLVAFAGFAATYVWSFL